MVPIASGTTIRFTEAPAVVCGECGYRTARVAELTDESGHTTGSAVVCLPCRERERILLGARSSRSTRPAPVPRPRRPHPLR
ncbi:hypothetical protein B0I33_11552 [Prauserella shujinwangii]|uniref:Uncharacterized protein n=1 Tax=Prauserella shujinwangii TaxID=1453103 RepID=A0A2T0LKL6_9PSEU|nr:hypothetical protein [Prauserella shujinwangii]PRX43434.1 hypothetical protein B0I33_11552 [Prauserella shujinwangii]